MPYLTILIALPLLGALALYLAPRADAWRLIGVGAAGVTMVWAVITAVAFRWGTGGYQLEDQAGWVPAIGASYHLAVDGLSLPLVLLSAALTFFALLYESIDRKRTRGFFALFLVMQAALTGLFCALDLLLFYFFWEATLVPMYFIIGVFGHERRLAAAIKFFLYTRVGGLALLLAIVGLYLGVEPHTFDLPAIVSATPWVQAPVVGGFILFGLLLAFGIKLPVVPFHAWLPDAHTEAPTGGSILLAGALLKMGGYGLLRIALPALPSHVARFSVWVAIIAAASAIYGALVALAQKDLKRLVAYSSVNHMGYVLLGFAVAGAPAATATARAAAWTGAGYQLVAHGVVTGALFLFVGMLARRAGTREIGALGGVWQALPAHGAMMALAMFAALGLPALANFAAEVQVLLGTVGVYWGAALAMTAAILITTALFVWTVQRVLMGEPGAAIQRLQPLTRRELIAGVGISALIILLGVAPQPITRLLHSAATKSAAAASLTQVPAR